MCAASAAQTSASCTPSAACVFAICAAEILSLAGYSVVPALLPQFIEAWSLSSTQAGCFAGSLFAGYMLAVVPLVTLTDTVPARTIYLLSSAVSAGSSLGGALSADLLPALAFRALGGIGLAGMYMPGLRALAEGTEGRRRSRIAGFYTSSFTIGTALSFLLGRAGAVWGWRTAFVVSAIAGSAGLAIAWAALPRSTSRPAVGSTGMFPLRAALHNRDAVILMIGYCATIWGAAGLRQWIVLFLGFCAGEPTESSWSTLAVASLIGLLGVPAGLLGVELALRYGLRLAATLIFLAAAIVTGLFGFASMLPFGAAVVTALAASFVAQGTFSNLTSGLLAVVAPRYAGVTMALYSCIGFGGGFLGNLLFGATLDGFGGAVERRAWIMSFGTCGLALLVGAGATLFLSHHVERAPTAA
jgi:predicted MFS family arabinose efflux permease